MQKLKKWPLRGMENFVSQTIEPKRFNCIVYTIDFFFSV